ncbi:hypothetical protein [uncultured Comamonas sp.]|uniref:hypothetical protein n=1 Tax=uncultured Comamonas sp. TaxID=114710 RepID=UPI003748A651
MIKILFVITSLLLAINLPARSEQANSLMEEHSRYIIEKAGDKYAGMWISDDNSTITLALTSNIDADKNVLKKFHIKYVQYSLLELESFQNSVLRRQFPEHIYIYETYINQKKNRVVIKAKCENFEKLKKLLKQRKIDLDKIFFENQDGPLNLFNPIDDGRFER